MKATVLVRPKPGNLGFHLRNPIAVLFRLTKDVRQLPFNRIKPVVEAIDRVLRCGRIVTEPGRVGRLTFREHLLLNLANLVLEPIDPLLRSRWTALRVGGAHRDGGNGNQEKDGTETHGDPRIDGIWLEQDG